MLSFLHSEILNVNCLYIMLLSSIHTQYIKKIEGLLLAKGKTYVSGTAFLIRVKNPLFKG